MLSILISYGNQLASHVLETNGKKIYKGACHNKSSINNVVCFYKLAFT